MKPSQNHRIFPLQEFWFCSCVPLRLQCPPETTTGSKMQPRGQNLLLVTVMQSQNCSSSPAGGKSLTGRVAPLTWEGQNCLTAPDLLSSSFWSDFCPLAAAAVVFCLESHGYRQQFAQSHPLKLHGPISREVFEVLHIFFASLKCAVCLKERARLVITRVSLWNLAPLLLYHGDPPRYKPSLDLQETCTGKKWSLFFFFFWSDLTTWSFQLLERVINSCLDMQLPILSIWVQKPWNY